jgi:hypothetical protein
MRKYLPFALVVAMTLSTPSYGWDLCSLLGIRCGLSCSSGCEPGCGCESSCGCEPSCGCGRCCGGGGEQFAGQTWGCCEESGPPICTCTGPAGCGDASCGCGAGCGCGGGCDPSCGCEPSCGCGSSCGCGNEECCLDGLCFGSACGRLVGLIDRLCCGCSGCSGEMYWSEWHNDPPHCCDHCDHYANWTGPSHGSHAVPYDQPHHVGGTAEAPYFAGPAPTGRSPRVAHSRSTARPTYVGQGVAPARQVRTSARPGMRGQITRKPSMGPNATYQR